MVETKGWEWENVDKSPWLKPTEDIYYLASRWADLGFKRVLDIGCGLGRHSIYLAEKGFDVSAIDLSDYAINHLKSWAEEKNLNIDCRISNMLSLPYEDNYFDAVFAYHSISHTTSNGMVKVASEIERVLKTNGEFFVSLCSKDSPEFTQYKFPKIDENTILCQDDGPETDVPHYYADREDILNLFHNFDIEKIRHTDYCYINHEKIDCKQYYINGHKK